MVGSWSWGSSGTSGAAAGPSGTAAGPSGLGKGAGGEVGEDGAVEKPSVRLSAAVSVLFLHSWAE